MIQLGEVIIGTFLRPAQEVTLKNRYPPLEIIFAFGESNRILL